MTEENKKAIEMMRKYYSIVSGIPINQTSEMPKGDSHVETSRECALASVLFFLEEHSCYTLLDERWAFWHNVEVYLKNI